MSDTKKISFESDTDETMRRLATIVSGVIGKDYGFMIMVFPFHSTTGTANYISNAKREQMISVLREKADILEAGGDIMVDADTKMQ